MTFGTNDWWPKICIGKAGRSPLFPNTNLANINILIGVMTDNIMSDSHLGENIN